MATFLMPPARQRGWTNANALAAGCLLYTYAAGTSTPKATYTDAAGLVPHPNPIVLDAKGEALIYWDGAYRIDLRTAAGVQITGYPVDDYITPDVDAAADALRGDLALSTGGDLVGIVKAFAGAVPTTQKEVADREVHVFDFLTAAQRLEAISGTVTLNMSTQIQAALSSGALDIDFGRYTYLATGLLVPAHVRSLTGSATIKCFANNTNLMQWIADTSRQCARYFGGGLKLDVNGKTGCAGLTVGSVTDNPSLGSQEAILYLSMRDVMITGFDCNLDSRVTMEHSYDNVTLKNGIVGMKQYSDPLNGGCNANSFRGLRLQGNQVGGIIRNMTAGFAVPLHNNEFNGLTLQENTVCGLAFIGAVGQSINSMHAESNGLGASSVVIDGETIYRSDVYMKGSQVSISGSDLASSLNPAFTLVESSRLTSNGMTGYGSSGNSKVSCDSTSVYHEIGAVSGIGVTGNHASYGHLVSIPGLAFMHGAPLISIERGANLYPSNPMYPDITNLVGTASSQNKKSEFGLTPEITFSGVVGSTSDNRLFMQLMTCVASKFNISTLLVRSSASSAFTFNWGAGASQLPVTVSLTANAWKRLVFASYDKADHSIYIFPADAAAASLQVQGVQCSSEELAGVASIYASGSVNVSTLRYNAYNVAPATGTWAVGDVVFNSAPAAGGHEGWICTTAGTPGTWKTFGPITA